MKCKFKSKIFQNKENGYCIALFKTEDTTVPMDARKAPIGKEICFTATGYNLPLNDGVEIEMTGKWLKSKFGLQFTVESCTEIIPKTEEGIVSYLSSGLIKGIGEKTAIAIYKRFGMKTLKIMDNSPERLLEIKGISENKLEKIIDSYNQSRSLRELMTYLAPFKVSPKKAAKIYQVFGSKSVDIIKRCPYELCNIKGFGFLTVDEIAKANKNKTNDPMRINGGLMYTLDQGLLNGHLYLIKDVLCKEAYEILNKNFPTQVVSIDEIAKCLYELTSQNKLILEDTKVYKPIFKKYEDDTAKAIATLLKYPISPISIEKELKNAQKELNIILSKEQANSVKMVFKNNLSIITGGPGTGKTTVLRVVLHIYEKVIGGEVLLVAPTGRASRRMAESTESNFSSTMHKALGLVADDDELYSSVDELNTDFVVADEFSMVDMRLASEFFTRIKKGTKVVLLGDFNQLPSVGAGNVFKELIASNVIPITTLDMVFRQGADSNIAINAHLMQENKSALFYGSDFIFQDVDNAEEAACEVTKRYMEEVSLHGVENVQILTPFKASGACSVNKLNEVIRELINPKAPYKKELKAGNQIFRIGDKILQTKNKGDISNGDIGFIKDIHSDDDGNQLVSIEFTDNRNVKYDIEDLDMIEMSYVMTIHKSQGSEYPVVIMPWLSMFYIMLKRNLLYTGITRAKTKVILVGEKKAIHMAIHTNDSNKRNTILAERLRRYCNIQHFTKQESKDEQLAIAL